MASKTSMENLPTSQPTTTPAAAKASVTPENTVIPSTTPQVSICYNSYNHASIRHLFIRDQLILEQQDLNLLF